MKNLLSKKLSICFASVVSGTMPFMLASFTSCSSANTIQFANYESYMDNDLLRYLEDTYDAQFQWFTISEMIETKFEHTYDMAVPSGYELCKLYSKGWLQKIDWKAILGIPQDEPFNPMSLFSEPAQELIQEMNALFKEGYPDMIPSDFDVLDYGIPYFAQSFCFVYKGEELTFYKNGSLTTTDEPNWADIFYTISPRCKYADRFGGSIGMLDDSRSIYDIARVVQSIEQYPEDENEWTNQMPPNSSIDDLKETFKAITNKAQSNWYRLSTDSGQIARILADHGDHGYNAALAWSGDALYAAQGAGEYESYTGEQMHTIKPKGASLDEIDFIVINKKNEHNTSKLSRIYKMIYDICFDSWKVDTEDELLSLSQDGSHFKYWSMQNWDTVSYVPMLKNIFDIVSKPESKYWDDYATSDDEATRELMTSLITIPTLPFSKSLFGRPLTDLENSNSHWAWLESRGNL